MLNSTFLRSSARVAIAQWLGTVLTLSFAAASAQAQSIGERVTKAAQKFAALSAEAAMSGATSLDLETRGLPTVSVRGLNVGVSHIEMKDSIAVRLHVFYHNPSDSAVSIPLPTDETLVLVDDKGRRLQFLSLKRERAPKGATELAVPALERVTFAAMYYVPNTDASEAILKVGTAGMIRGIPLKTTPLVPPPLAAAPPATKDTVISPKASTRPPSITPKPPS
jgi:hypothetical protein